MMNKKGVKKFRQTKAKMVEMAARPVVLDYNDLVDPNTDLNEYIERAFGSGEECLGLCFVSNVPNLLEKRLRLLRLASSLAALPEEELKALESPGSHYSFGWSHGKEIMVLLLVSI